MKRSDTGYRLPRTMRAVLRIILTGTGRFRPTGGQTRADRLNDCPFTHQHIMSQQRRTALFLTWPISRMVTDTAKRCSGSELSSFGRNDPKSLDIARPLWDCDQAQYSSSLPSGYVRNTTARCPCSSLGCAQGRNLPQPPSVETLGILTLD